MMQLCPAKSLNEIVINVFSCITLNSSIYITFITEFICFCVKQNREKYCTYIFNNTNKNSITYNLKYNR